MSRANYGSLPFAEQIAFFRRKLKLPTTSWADIWQHEHDWAFVVAGAARDALLEDLRRGVEAAIVEGISLEKFKTEYFDQAVARHGWDYHGGRDWRAQVIYQTNLATSRAAGRWQQLQAAPYWRYEHSDLVEHPRPEHQAWDGLVLRRDDPFWRTHFPPNGWGCRCTVRGLWPEDLAELGKSGPDPAPPIEWEQRTVGKNSALGPRTVTTPRGIDPGFAYAPGAARLASAMPPERPEPVTTKGSGSMARPGLPNRRAPDDLPPPRLAHVDDVLPKGLSAPAYAQAFLQEFGATLDKPALFTDAVGERVVVGKELFQNAKGEWKADKNGRGPYMRLIAQTLKNPDEVWAYMEYNQTTKHCVVRRRYISRLILEGQQVPALVVFERGADGWIGVTAFTPDLDEYPDYLEEPRLGVRLWRRR